MYLFLYVWYILNLIVVVIGAGYTLYIGEGWDYFYSEHAGFIRMYASSYLAAYYVKWEFVYGPPSKERANAATNG